MASTVKNGNDRSEKWHRPFQMATTVYEREISTGELVKLGFSARHANISVWVLTQELSSIAKPFRENVAAIVLFYTPSAKTPKAIFEEYAGELSQDDLKKMIVRLKEHKFYHLVFSLRHPYEIKISN